MHSVLRIAQKAHHKGISVIPVGQKDKRPCFDLLPDKKWDTFKRRLPNQGEVILWFNDRSINYGIICGKVSEGLVVLDFDHEYALDHKGTPDKSKILTYAENIFNEFRESHKDILEKTLTVRTGTGGIHVYLYMEDLPKNKNHSLKYKEKPVTVDVRSIGGYVVGPGSLHSNGNRYEIITGDFETIQKVKSLESLGFSSVKKEPAREPEPVVTKSEAHERARNYISHMEPAIAGRRGHDKTFHVACLLVKGFSLDQETALKAMHEYNERCIPKWSDEELRHKIEDAGLQPGHTGYMLESLSGKSTLEKITTVLSILYDIRYNEITDRIELKKKEEPDYEDINERSRNDIFISVYSYLYKRDHAKGITKEKVNNIIDSNYVLPYHPFKAFFDSLPKWDGLTDHIGTLASTVQISEKRAERNLWERSLKTWLMGYYAQSTGQGQNHLCLVLSGRQGIGKTTFLNKLSIDSKYTYVGAFIPNKKDSEVLLTDKSLIILDELEATTRFDIAHLKSQITKEFVSIRKAYRRDPETIKRYASFAGSINNSEFLTDASGNRRWLVVEALSIQLNKLSETLVKNALSQAKALVERGERYWLEAQDIEVLNQWNERYEKESLEESLILKYFRPGIKGGQSTEQMNATDVRLYIEKKQASIRNLNLISLGKYMHKHKFQKVIKNGKRFWLVEVRDLSKEGHQKDIDELRGEDGDENDKYYF